MKEVEAIKLHEYENDPAFRKAVNEYQNLCTIRRDLRKANYICQHIIDLHNGLKSEKIRHSDVNEHIVLASGAAMHAIVLYARWFKATEGKTRLEPQRFFSCSSNLMKVHDGIILHRDKYIAHNQSDLLGGDSAWLEFSEDGSFQSLKCMFKEELWFQNSKGDGLDMNAFQECIHVVHNKIDAELVPKAQWKLERQCRRFYK